MIKFRWFPPKYSKIAEHFYEAYNKVCSEVGIPLETECLTQEKAFGPTTRGTVLGWIFNSDEMSWSLGKEKVESILDILDQFLLRRTCSLAEVQKMENFTISQSPAPLRKRHVQPFGIFEKI